MFRIKDSNGETIISFNEKGDWEFNIDRRGYIDLLTQKDIDMGKVYGGKPIKRYATQERAIEVIKDIVDAIVNRHEKVYVLPEK